MVHNRCLALASLALTSLLAASAASAQVTDARLALPVDPAAIPAADLSSDLSPDLPDDPSAPLQQTQAGQPQSAGTQPAQNPSAPNSEDQLKQQEHQRVFGVMAAFNTTRNHDALPLTPSQKFQLFFKSQTDPWPFGLAAVVAGFGQATNSPSEYGQGVEGYAKRYGATYADAFIGNFWGNAVLPSLWHEDPRYFQKGTGSYGSRALWAATSTVWCKRDSGTWGPNYSNVVGNLIGAAIANVYYPDSERTVGDTVTRGLTVSAEGIVGAEIIEFWPDIVRHYRKKQAEKDAKRASQNDAEASRAEAAAPAVAQPASEPTGP